MLIFCWQKTISHTTKGLIKNAESVAVKCCFVIEQYAADNSSEYSDNFLYPARFKWTPSLDISDVVMLHFKTSTFVHLTPKRYFPFAYWTPIIIHAHKDHS